MATTNAQQRPRPASVLSRGWTFLRIRGVPIRLDVSWLLICGLVVYLFVTRFTVMLRPYGPGAVFAAAFAATVLFFASILAHELGHALTSLDRGIPVTGVTLFLLGGVTESSREPARARDEFVIVGAGPFVSLVLAAGFGLLFAIRPDTSPYGVVTGYLAWMNLALAVFNVLPGYPLDGGRLLRALFWGASGRQDAATRWAARVGQAFALSLVLGGLNGVFGRPVAEPDGLAGIVVATLAANGLWSVLVGVFLLRGASDAHRRAAARERVDQHTIAELMGTAPPTLPADLTVGQAGPRIASAPSLLFPVGDPMVGGITHGALDAVPLSVRDTTTLGAIALGVEEVTVDVATPLSVAIGMLRETPYRMLIVVEDGQPVGLLTPSLLGGIVR